MVTDLAVARMLANLDVISLDLAVENPLDRLLQLGRRPQLGKVAADQGLGPVERNGRGRLAFKEDDLETRADRQEEKVCARGGVSQTPRKSGRRGIRTHSTLPGRP